ncbi:hypothetical protein AJ87_09840 [Rhizobium yanglingense]|nr:hypothetical protein AJ87_09840 [Rhizobium yanglingense]
MCGPPDVPAVDESWKSVDACIFSGALGDDFRIAEAVRKRLAAKPASAATPKKPKAFAAEILSHAGNLSEIPAFHFFREDRDALADLLCIPAHLCLIAAFEFRAHFLQSGCDATDLVSGEVGLFRHSILDLLRGGLGGILGRLADFPKVIADPGFEITNFDWLNFGWDAIVHRRPFILRRHRPSWSLYDFVWHFQSSQKVRAADAAITPNRKSRCLFPVTLGLHPTINWRIASTEKDIAPSLPRYDRWPIWLAPNDAFPPRLEREPDIGSAVECRRRYWPHNGGQNVES